VPRANVPLIGHFCRLRRGHRWGSVLCRDRCPVAESLKGTPPALPNGPERVVEIRENRS
jgi:hypothetical protein